MSINPEIKNLYTSAVIKSEMLEKFRKCFENKNEKKGKGGRPKLQFKTDEEREEHNKQIQYEAYKTYYAKRRRDKLYEKVKNIFDELTSEQQIRLVNELIKRVSI